MLDWTGASEVAVHTGLSRPIARTGFPADRHFEPDSDDDPARFRSPLIARTVVDTRSVSHAHLAFAANPALLTKLLTNAFARECALTGRRGGTVRAMPTDDDQGTRPSVRSHGSGKTTGRMATSLVCALLVLATPVATWYLVGDLSEPSLSPAESDYLVHPLPIPHWLGSTAGVLALVLVAACALILYRNHRSGSVTPQEWIVLVLLLPAGLITGFGTRVVTAGAIGANIGAGLVLIFAFPLAAVLVLAAVIYLCVSLMRQRRR